MFGQKGAESEGDWISAEYRTSREVDFRDEVMRVENINSYCFG